MCTVLTTGRGDYRKWFLKLHMYIYIFNTYGRRSFQLPV